MLHSTIDAVTTRIRERSRQSRDDYLAVVEQTVVSNPRRGRLSCSNLAHGFAAEERSAKDALAGVRRPNVGIVTAYNDMLSAHQPFARFPSTIKKAAWEAGGVAQVAAGVPAMCDGVTQGQPGMELSLFSRDVIAMATAVGLSHDMFDAAICLGVCDKIVPGMLIGALSFGHLPVVFAPAGPMVSGLPNAEKARVRQAFAEGKADRETLLRAESGAYHAPGTCTFYGTANSNQLLMEFMGLHLPGASFVNPDTPLREALTVGATRRALEITAQHDDYTPVGRVIDEKAIVNGIIGLLASGGSTNHTMHLVAIARAAGIVIDWQDFDELSAVVPLLARVYPNGKADVNHFHAAGGIALLIRELLANGLLHDDVTTIAGHGLGAYTEEPFLDDGVLRWRAGPDESLDDSIVASVAQPFSANGGLKLMTGNLGRAIAKVSAVAGQHRVVEAPARVFDDQRAVADAFRAGELNRDVVVVVVNQGPRANGMPELHKLTPVLGVLQDRGFAVALVTDGRMSGASGKVPSAIQVTPESTAGGMLAKVRDGDPMTVDTVAGVLRVDVIDAELASREPFAAGVPTQSLGRALFANFRAAVTSAEHGGSVLDAGSAAQSGAAARAKSSTESERAR